MLTILTVAIGGIVEVVPLFTIETTVEHVKGVRPYSPLELRGRDIYVREGCYLCHSQQIRALRDEVERYGHYSLAAESMYDHPFQWGSKRIGPDLARVGGKYSNDWHYAHLTNPQALVPESLMPRYAFLAETPLRTDDIEQRMRVNRMIGVPYTDDDIANAKADLLAQADPRAERGDAAGALSQGQFRARRRPSGRPKWTRWWPICRCSARWSISPTPAPRSCSSSGDRRMGFMDVMVWLMQHSIVVVGGVFILIVVTTYWPRPQGPDRAGRADPARRRSLRRRSCADKDRERHRLRPRNHRPRLGRRQGTEHAAAEMVAVSCSPPAS